MENLEKVEIPQK